MDEQNVFKSELSKFLLEFEPYAASFYKGRIEAAGEYSEVIADLYEKLGEFSTGGKRMRGFFVYLGYLIGGGVDTQRIMPISLAFEMTQNFLLIHDDIMDKSDLRRGKPTVHRTYGEKFGEDFGVNMAMTLGDIASIEAFRIIGESDFEDEKKVVCTQEFSKVLLETAYGQALDLEFSFEEASLDQVYRIADLKAARYSVVGPLLIGAKLGEVSSEAQEAITDFGLNAGLAFQIQDDILGVFGEEETIGKSVLSDMREGKNTILIHKAREMASEADRKRLEEVWGKHDATYDDLKVVRQIVEDSGALEWSRSENMRLVLQAKEKVEKITKDSNLQAVLSQIADFVVNRES